MEETLRAFAVNAEGVASATCYLGFEDKGFGGEDKGFEDKKDKKNKVDNPGNPGKIDNPDNPESTGPGKMPLQMQLALDFGSPAR